MISNSGRIRVSHFWESGKDIEIKREKEGGWVGKRKRKLDGTGNWYSSTSLFLFGKPNNTHIHRVRDCASLFIYQPLSFRNIFIEIYRNNVWLAFVSFSQTRLPWDRDTQMKNYLQQIGACLWDFFHLFFFWLMVAVRKAHSLHGLSFSGE